ncbi:hypothetical protein PG985_007971 [Apiospora marii]|uniref:uncharacterized protein n=1 Tax=Apiospora marii TaxID=335849 RepID=UPI0031323834
MSSSRRGPPEKTLEDGTWGTRESICRGYQANLRRRRGVEGTAAYLRQAGRKRRHLYSREVRSFRPLWKRFLKQSIFGGHRDGECELEIMHQALTGAASGRHPAERLTLCYQSPFLAPETAEGAAAFRAEHRRRRALPPDGRAYGWDRGLHPRYFLVMDKAGFPPVDAVVFTNRVALPGVWVYDADWAPLFGGYGVRRDFDGYEGRLRPLTRQEGFDLKKLWMQQGEDHSKPYPFPGHEMTEEAIRVRVLYGDGSIPSGGY